MKKLQTQCALIEKGKSRKFPNFRLYAIDAFFKVDGETIEKNWTVEAESIFAADRWANLMIENIAGTLTGAKKQIVKL